MHRRARLPRRRCTALLPLLLAGLLPGQQPAEGGEPPQAVPRDPYTLGQQEAMAAAGVLAYGPLPWADRQSTDDVDRVLGRGRVLWLETAHFRIGCALGPAPLPDEQGPKKALLEELQALHDKLPKVPRRPRRLDPWLRLHLYAQRAEALYAEVQQLLGVTDASFPGGPQPPDGKYLGLPGKFLLLLFQKKADLARHLDRFCGVHGDAPMRYYHSQSCQMLFAAAAEGCEGGDAALHSEVIYSLVHNLVAGFRGYTFELPPWLEEGLAHYYSRRIETDFINVTPRPGEAVDDRDKHEWARKVRLRAQHDGAFIPFEQMLAWRKSEELGYLAHIQSWSRVDFLMSLGRERVGVLVRKLKALAPPVGTAEIPPATMTRVQLDALAELWQFDPAGFDAAWRQWVQKAYAGR